jgi:hypothetical protein
MSVTTRGVNRWRGVAANALAHAGSFSTPWVMSWSASPAARGVQSVSSMTVSMGPLLPGQFFGDGFGDG